jgi:hypothetical protein
MECSKPYIINTDVTKTESNQIPYLVNAGFDSIKALRIISAVESFRRRSG